VIGRARRLVAPFTAFLLLFVFPAFAQESLEDSIARSRAEQTIKRIDEALKERPNDGALQFYMAMFQAQAGHREQSLEWLRRVAARHMGFHPTAGTGFDAVWNDAEFQQVLAEIAAQEPKVTDAKEAFRLSDPKFIPEGIAYDPDAKRYFVGSVAQRRILERTRKGKFVEFSRESDGLNSVLGLRVDAPRGLLYAVSTNGFSILTGEASDNALFVYDLRTRALRARYGAPEALNFNDVAVGPNGEVAVTDSGTGAVYRLDTQSGELIFLVPPRGLWSANGLVFAPDGKRLYVAVATGVAVVELASGRVERVRQPDDIATAAIDGLYWYDGDLVGVQNTICPGRVVRLDLNEDGTAISGLTVLQAYHPLLDEPTTGAIVGRNLQVIANSQVARVQPNGTLRDEPTLENTVILSVPLARP
jgi:streptogramin lyase